MNAMTSRDYIRTKWPVRRSPCNCKYHNLPQVKNLAYLDSGHLGTDSWVGLQVLLGLDLEVLHHLCHRLCFLLHYHKVIVELTMKKNITFKRAEGGQYESGIRRFSYR